MRLWGVAMVRNEADVIEAFVRHNVGVLDGLAIIDHGSFDGTAEILAALEREGLPIRLERDGDPAFQQSLRVTQTIRDTLRDQHADFVFALDADEFVRAQHRERLERALLDVPRGMHAVARWRTYVPHSFDDGLPFGPGHLRRRLKVERRESQGYHKVIVGRGLLERPNDRVTEGNHTVGAPSESAAGPHARLREDIAIVAHCPVRSRSQLESKVIIGHLAYLARPSRDKTLGFHWRDLYDDLRAGDTLTHDRLLEIACNYGLARDDWLPVPAIELIDDPVSIAFELRYRGAKAPDTLRRLMLFAEALVARGK
jgi:hypothetical protein